MGLAYAPYIHPDFKQPPDGLIGIAQSYGPPVWGRSGTRTYAQTTAQKLFFHAKRGTWTRPTQSDPEQKQDQTGATVPIEPEVRVPGRLQVYT